MLKTLIKLICLLPHRAALSLGSFLGYVLWLLSWKKVDTCEERCVAALGVGITDSRAIVKESFRNIGRSAVEFIKLEKIKPKLDELVIFPDDGQEILREAQSRGHGVLLMAAHIDNWELAGARIAMAGFDITPIYTPQRNKGGINDFILHQRSDVAGMKMVKSEGGALREVFRTLRSGGIIGVLQDLDARKEGIIINFLGMPASTHDGIVKLHKKFKSPVVPVLYLRDKKDRTRHKIVINQILSDRLDENGRPFGENMESSLRMCNEVIESWIKSNPAQWLWLIDRWEYTFRQGLLR